MVEEKALQVSDLARASLLRVADKWRSLGQINQAIGVYLKILHQYPGSREAEDARERLLGLAATFERGGRYRLAMDLYERVERACRC